MSPGRRWGPAPEFAYLAMLASILLFFAWLAVWWGSYEGGGVRFMRRSEFGWDPLETVPTAESELLDFAFPQVTEYGGPTAPLPRIYYNDMDMEPCLKYVDWQFGGGWTEPVAYVGDYAFGSEFDVARTVRETRELYASLSGRRKR